MVRSLAGIVSLGLLSLTTQVCLVAQSNWRVVTQPGGDTFVAPFSVRDFGAKGDGKTDDTPAFKWAIESLGKAGGGSLYVPEGRYVLRQTLHLPRGVVLRGVWHKPIPGRPVKGTILCCYSGKGNANGRPFINMTQSTGVRDMAFFYPEQDPANPIAYPYTLHQLVGDNATIENITLINAYQGIRIGPGWNELHFIRNVYGTALKNGLWYDFTTDIGRLENIHFSPAYWSGSGLPGAPPANGPHAAWMLKNGIGIHMKRSDWEYGAFVTIDGYHTGFRISRSDRGAPNAQFYSYHISNCINGLDIEDANPMGLAFTACDIEAKEDAVILGHEFNSILMLQGCRLAGKTAVRNGGPGAVSMHLCEVSRGSLTFERGSVSLTGCKFGADASVLLDERMTGATVLGNSFAGKPVIGNRTKNIAVYINHTPYPFRPLPVVPRLANKTCKPARSALYLVTRFGAKRDGRTDDTTAIQTALTAAGKDGGGIVFLPPGDYAVHGRLSIPGGVELKGIFDCPHHTQVGGSVLHIYGGKGKATGPATVTLTPRSGIRGVSFYYPEQKVSSAMVKYPYLLQGRGADIYIINVNAGNVYQYLDLSSYRCDNHYVDYLSGCPLRVGVKVGAGSRNGAVVNTQFNPHYWNRCPERNPLYDNKPVGGAWRGGGKILFEYQLEHLDAMVFGNCVNPYLFQNFVFGSLYGIHFIDQNDVGASGGIVHGHGTDASKVGVKIDGCGADGLNFINTELVGRHAGDKRFIHLGPAVNGQVHFYNTLCWGDVDRTGVVESGLLSLHQAHFLTHGNGFHLNGGKLGLINCHYIEIDDILKMNKDRPATLIGNNLRGELLIDGKALEPVADLETTGTITHWGNLQRDLSLSKITDTIKVALDQKIHSAGLEFCVKNSESVNTPVKRNGRYGWKSNARPNTNLQMMYFKTIHPRFMKGRAPNLEFRLTYFDEGTGTVELVYDSSDKRVNAGKQNPGAWKVAGTIKLTNSRRWRTRSFMVDDALMAWRCNGYDVRLNIRNKPGLTIREFAIRKRP